MKDNLLFFDIETIADESAMEEIEVFAPANYKDPEKIQAYIDDEKKKLISRMALDPDLAKVYAISYKYSDADTMCMVTDEKDMLEHFWDEVRNADGRLCGYNIIGFDLPFLMRRSMALGVSAPMHMLNFRKYQTYPIVDLMGILYNWDKAKGLKWVCKRYGIVNNLPELDGSKVATMDIETLARYAINDVNLTVALYEKMNGVYF
jgi:DNA polymerase elongation subunit (family B)